MKIDNYPGFMITCGDTILSFRHPYPLPYLLSKFIKAESSDLFPQDDSYTTLIIYSSSSQPHKIAVDRKLDRKESNL